MNASPNGEAGVLPLLNYTALFILQGGGEGCFTQTGGASDGFITLIKPLDYDYGRSVFALNVTVTVSS